MSHVAPSSGATERATLHTVPQTQSLGQLDRGTWPWAIYAPQGTAEGALFEGGVFQLGTGKLAACASWEWASHISHDSFMSRCGVGTLTNLVLGKVQK